MIFNFFLIHPCWWSIDSLDFILQSLSQATHFQCWPAQAQIGLTTFQLLHKNHTRLRNTQSLPLPTPKMILTSVDEPHATPWQHVAESYKGRMTFDWREYGLKGKVSTPFLHSKAHTNSRIFLSRKKVFIFYFYLFLILNSFRHRRYPPSSLQQTFKPFFSMISRTTHEVELAV